MKCARRVDSIYFGSIAARWLSSWGRAGAGRKVGELRHPGAGAHAGAGVEQRRRAGAAPDCPGQGSRPQAQRLREVRLAFRPHHPCFHQFACNPADLFRCEKGEGGGASPRMNISPSFDGRGAGGRRLGAGRPQSAAHMCMAPVFEGPVVILANHPKVVRCRPACARAPPSVAAATPPSPPTTCLKAAPVLGKPARYRLFGSLHQRRIRGCCEARLCNAHQVLVPFVMVAYPGDVAAAGAGRRRRRWTRRWRGRCATRSTCRC